MRTKFADLEIIASNYPYVKRILGEDRINLEQNDVESNIGDNWIIRGRNHLKFNNAPIHPKFDSIPLNQLDILFNEVSSISIPGPFITALKVMFVSKNGQLDLRFQPIKLSYRYRDHNNQKHNYQISALGKTYYLENDTFKVERNDIKTLIQEYRDNIKILKDPTNPDTFSNHELGVDSLYMIFPFQLIYQLLLDNLSDNLDLFNVAIGTEDSDVAPFFHSLLLKAVINGSGPITPEMFTNKYADRSHLCPPCSGDYFGFTRE